jgi:hypothetical protein
MSENNHELSPPQYPVAPPMPSQAKEIFPVRFDKDLLDFRGIPEEDEPVVPKDSSAPVYVETQKSVTGLEDVSAEDLEMSVLNNAEKDTKNQPATG